MHAHVKYTFDTTNQYWHAKQTNRDKIYVYGSFKQFFLA